MLKRALLCVTLMASIACSKPDHAKDLVEEPVDTTAIMASVDSIVSKHNAISRWETQLEWVGMEPVYSVDIQDILMDTSKRPILFYGTLEDLERKGQGYIARFEPEDPRTWDLVSFQLACDEHTKQQLLVSPPDRRWGDGLAVVCSIQSVEKLRFSIDVETDGEDVTTAEVSVGSSPEKFLARGTLLSAVRIKKLSDYLTQIEQKKPESKLK
jgi:hypothetical protein